LQRATSKVSLALHHARHSLATEHGNLKTAVREVCGQAGCNVVEAKAYLELHDNNVAAAVEALRSDMHWERNTLMRVSDCVQKHQPNKGKSWKAKLWTPKLFRRTRSVSCVS